MTENSKRNRWKIGFWICLALLLLTGITATFAIVDQGLTLTHLRESHQETQADLQTVVKLINETDLTKNEIEFQLQNHRLRKYMNFKSNSVSLERVQLRFENGRLEKMEVE